MGTAAILELDWRARKRFWSDLQVTELGSYKPEAIRSWYSGIQVLARTPTDGCEVRFRRHELWKVNNEHI